MAINVSSDWLKKKYIDEELDCVKIGLLVGRHPKSVWSWLRALGIPTRKRGMNKALQFKPGMRTRLGKKHSPETKNLIRNARLADGRFPLNPDGTPYWTGKSGNEHPTWTGGHTPERQQFYGSAEWKAVRPQVYSRADNHCERCGADRSNNLHIHHIVSFSCVELRANLSNLALLCRPCHLFVHSGKNTTGEYRESIS